MKLALYSLLILSAVGGIFYTGYKMGKNNERVVYQERVIEANSSRERIEHENKAIDHNTIVKRLNNNGWLRDE